MKEKKFTFVPKKVYKPFFNRCYKLLIPLTKLLKENGIKSNLYPIGSGNRHLVTQLIVNGERNPFDLDFNLEIDLKTLPQKYEDLKKLKDFIRGSLNKIISEQTESKKRNDFFSDGQDSTSVISIPLRFKDSENIEFSFDLAIVSRNTYGKLQRLIHNKKTEEFTWVAVKNTKNIEYKADCLKGAELWNKVRERYLFFKNQFVNDCNHPSFVCYIMAVNEVYDQTLPVE